MAQTCCMEWITSWSTTVEITQREWLLGSNTCFTCVITEKTSKYLEATETLPMVPLGTLMLKTQSGSEKSPSLWYAAECSCASVVLDAESERWGGCHAAPGPAGGAVLRVAAAAVWYPGRGAALWRAAAHRSAAESPEANDRWACCLLSYSSMWQTAQNVVQRAEMYCNSFSYQLISSCSLWGKFVLLFSLHWC